MNKYKTTLYNITETDDVDKRIEYRSLLQELVEKATPMKVKKNVEEFSYCPNCSMVVAEKNRIKSMNYCSNCGQAIDWSDGSE